MSDDRRPDIDPDADETRRIHLHMPVDVRSVSLAVLAALAIVFALRAAAPVFVPLILGLVFSYALGPIVDRIQRFRIHRALATGLLMTCIAGGMGWTAYALSDDASALIESLPDAAQKLRDALRARHRSESAMDKVQKAATQLERAADDGTAVATTPPGVMRVQMEPSRFNVKDYLWTGSLGLMALLGQAAIVFFITYFLIASGSTFRRKMVKLAGPTISQKKITLQALDEITGQIQRYLLVQLLMSVLVGFATWLIFMFLGLQHSAVWGVVSGVLNFIPYIGPVAVTGGAALVAFLQFGTLDMGLLVAGLSLGLHIITGYLLTPWLTSRASRMNAVSVFVGVLAFGWLWGVWGLLLGVPILMAVKAVCDRVDDLKAVGELLGT